MLKLVVEIDAENFLIILICSNTISAVVALEEYQVRTVTFVMFTD